MIFKDFKTQVLNYSRFQGKDLENNVTVFLNQSIIDFLRKKEWDKTIFKYTLTLDGSGEYDLKSLITNYFFNINRVIKPGTNYSVKQFIRLGFDEYLNSSSKDNLWSMLGNILYIAGDSGTIEIFYQSPGEDYPVSGDDDEPQVLIDYSDILEKMVVIKLLVQIGDVEGAVLENQTLQNMLNDARRSENRSRHKGSSATFSTIRR